MLDEIGKNPKWNPPLELTFDINEHLDEIKVSVLDKDLMTSDYVGGCTLQVDEWVSKGGREEWVDITYTGRLGKKNKPAGKLLIKSAW